MESGYLDGQAHFVKNSIDIEANVPYMFAEPIFHGCSVVRLVFTRN